MDGNLRAEYEEFKKKLAKAAEDKSESDKKNAHESNAGRDRSRSRGRDQATDSRSSFAGRMEGVKNAATAAAQTAAAEGAVNLANKKV